MNTTLMDPRTVSDEQLWQASRSGDLEAFGRIVERYQSLICALAYSGTGDLATSQDLAQEAFVAAWRRLGELREPAKLRAWLCGIVRNPSAGTMRRDLRRGGAPQALDAVAEPISLDEDPETQFVTREEETILWRALAGMPDTYREPMVLFSPAGWFARPKPTRRPPRSGSRRSGSPGPSRSSSRRSSSG